MRFGISSSCFYPLETERSLELIGQTGAKLTEVFFNAPSELHGPLLRELCDIRDRFGMQIAAIHPFMSFAEDFYLFSDYERRFFDSLDFYKYFFSAGQALGASLFVLHGARHLHIEKERYAERLFRLNETAKPFGLRVAHENVVHYVGESPGFMAFLQKHLGDDFQMVLDLKQARRAGEDPFAFIDRVGKSIVHVHISDGDDLHDCLPPGTGTFDFSRLFSALDSIGYNGAYMIELYRRNFDDSAALSAALTHLQSYSSFWKEK